MSIERDIEFLQEFREKIQRYLFVGFAPHQGDLFPNPGRAKMLARLEDDEEFRDLRRQINEGKGRAQQLLTRLEVPNVYVQYPPPAVGGPILQFNLLDLITENQTAEAIDTETFLDRIDEAIGKLKAREEIGEPPLLFRDVKVTAGFVFIAMPMDPSIAELDDVHDAIKEIALELNLNAERIDEPESNEKITDRILSSLETAEFVVADLTYTKANVYYEAGYAHALGKIPIYIARTGTRIEFDLKDYPVIFFSTMRELKGALRRRLGTLRAQRSQ